MNRTLKKLVRHAASRIGMLAPALLLLTSVVSYTAAQEASLYTLPFSRGEELVYQAEFTRSLLRKIDVAEFHFKANTVRAQAEDGSVANAIRLNLMGDVVSKGLFVRIAGFHFHQHVESVFDPNRFVVLRTQKSYEQGKRGRISEATFDHQLRKVTWSERDPAQSAPAAVTTVDFSEPIQDVLTVIYFLRMQHLEVGKSFEVPLTDSGRVYRMAFAVMERKRIDTVLGRVNAFRVDPAMFGADNLSPSRGRLSIWITDDDRHLPVKAQLKVDLGVFDIKLKKVSLAEATER